jgi:heterotetrameric sarcosine oxidase gamma subunit
MPDHKAARGCRLSEITGWSLVQVAAFPGTAAAVETALAAAIGPGPIECGTLVRSGDFQLFRAAPNVTWVMSDIGAVPDIRLDPSQGCITPLTDGRRRFRIDGPSTRDALAKAVALDLDPASFGIGRAALTGIHHVPVFLARVDDDAYDIFMPRTFASDLVHWLADAALEFGVSLAVDGKPHGHAAERGQATHGLEAVA